MKFISKIVFAILLGIALTTGLIQHQDEFKFSVKNKLKLLAETSLNCDIDFDVHKINLFSPAIELSNVYVCEKNNQDWFWQCKKLNINCSWLDYLFTKNFDAFVQFDELQMYTVSNNSDIAILPHLKKLILSDEINLPIAIKNLSINKALINLVDKELKIKTDLEFNCQAKYINNGLRANFNINNGKILNNEIICCKNISGNIKINAPVSKKDKLEILVNNLFELPILNNSQCFLIGKLENNNGKFKISTVNGNLIIDPINISYVNNKFKLETKLQTPICYIQKFLNFPCDMGLNGDCKIDLNALVSNKDQEITCNTEIINLSCDSLPFVLNNLKINILKQNNYWSGDLCIENNSENKNIFKLLGDFNWDEKKNSGKTNLINNTEIFLDKTENWSIKPNNLSLKTQISNNKKIIKSNYICIISNKKTDKNISSNGEILITPESIKSTGILLNQKYNFRCKLKPDINIQDFSYEDDNGNECINIKSFSGDPKELEITINYQNLKNLFKDFLIHMPGEGIIKINGKINPNGFIGDLKLINGSIMISKTYNIIKSIEGSINIDIKEREIILKNFFITLYKGSIKCLQAKILFDDLSNFVPTFIHCPILINNCFLNWKGDILATLSGHLMLKKINDNYSATGNLIIDRAQIKNNIFSDDFRKELLGNNNYQNLFNQNELQLNVSFISKSPIKIKTPFFESQARIDLTLKKNLSNPEASGVITLSGGSITFPYKSLNIINGNIHFLENQPYDPLINLMARNKIRKYTITMHVTGSAQNQHITFESSPPLSEEQIGTLLLIGSENASLNSVMPALITQNIKNIILGSSKTHTQIEKYLKAFLKPFKYIKFVPSFSDETGRSGFKGAVEIDVNDKLRGSIEKNFSQTEDFKVEIDYDVTDETSIKIIKDERGDLGGEFEMRWKF